MFRSNSIDSERAFKEIYLRYSSNIHAYCYKILDDKMLAEDIFQETFIKFYRNINLEYTNTNIQAYILKIARNLCLNSKRDKKEYLPLEGYEFHHHDSNLEQKELLHLIDIAIDLLDNDHKEVFILRELDGLSYEDIANITNKSAGNAKSIFCRAKKKIREILHPYLYELNKMDK